uniref:ARAD1C09966p n=1 Tax=Blastobotrys adeninivorans TaxID=409370 RepID=A0A060T605_BLAAD
MTSVCCDFILVVVAIVFPPLPVWIKVGICSADSLINIALCVLGFLPGLFHSWYIISKYPAVPPGYDDIERQGVNDTPATYGTGSSTYGATSENAPSYAEVVRQGPPQGNGK